jgi:hypothetical protein
MPPCKEDNKEHWYEQARYIELSTQKLALDAKRTFQLVLTKIKNTLLHTHRILPCNKDRHCKRIVVI